MKHLGKFILVWSVLVPFTLSCSPRKKESKEDIINPTFDNYIDGDSASIDSLICYSEKAKKIHCASEDSVAKINCRSYESSIDAMNALIQAIGDTLKADSHNRVRELINTIKWNNQMIAENRFGEGKNDKLVGLNAILRLENYLDSFQQPPVESAQNPPGDVDSSDEGSGGEGSGADINKYIPIVGFIILLMFAVLFALWKFRRDIKPSAHQNSHKKFTAKETRDGPPPGNNESSDYYRELKEDINRLDARITALFSELEEFKKNSQLTPPKTEFKTTSTQERNVDQAVVQSGNAFYLNSPLDDKPVFQVSDGETVLFHKSIYLMKEVVNSKEWHLIPLTEKPLVVKQMVEEHAFYFAPFFEYDLKLHAQVIALDVDKPAVFKQEGDFWVLQTKGRLSVIQ